MDCQIPIYRSTSPDSKCLESYLRKIQNTGRLTNFGPLSCELEDRLRKRCRRSVIATASGTSALYLSLLVAPRSSDQVAVPSFNFSAGLQAILQSGRRPLFIEVNERFEIDLDHLYTVLASNANCSVVMAVNYFGWAGNPAEVQEVVDGFRRRGREIFTIFDSAHSYGTSYAGVPVGCFGDVEVFSFSATKPFGGAEGGALICNDELADAVRVARNYGSIDGQVMSLGTNGKLSEPNAAFILARLEFHNEIIEERRRLMIKMTHELEDIEGISLPVISERWDPVVKDYVVRLPGMDSSYRDCIRHRLATRGIETRTYFSPPLHKSPLMAQQAADLPLTDRLASEVIALPFYETMSSDQIRYIANNLRAAIMSV